MLVLANAVSQEIESVLSPGMDEIHNETGHTKNQHHNVRSLKGIGLAREKVFQNNKKLIGLARQSAAK